VIDNKTDNKEAQLEGEGRSLTPLNLGRGEWPFALEKLDPVSKPRRV